MASSSPSCTSAPRPSSAAAPFALLALLAPSLLTSAAEPTTGLRQTFLQAEGALRAGDRARYRALRPGLVDYPLYPYLLSAELRVDLSAAPAESVHAFLNRYPDSPLSDSLRRAWITVAFGRKDWDEVVRSYAPTQEPETRCQYLAALVAMGEIERAVGETPEVWLTGRPLPAVCDTVVAAWQASGGPTADLVWRRIGLAMDSGQTALARRLGGSLEPALRDLVEAWVALRREPEGLASAAALADDRSEVRQVVVDLLSRRARQDPEGAGRVWRELEARHAFSGDQIAAVQKAVGRALLRRDDAHALEWLGAIAPSQADAEASASGALGILRLGRWEDALDWIARLPPAERSSERWRYWAARADAARGALAEATRGFSELAAERSFYGFLAADRAGASYALTSTPVVAAAAEVARVETLPGVLRARELRTLGRTPDARREWARALRDLSVDAVAAAGLVAHRWGWHDQAITALSRAGQLGDLEIRFPLAHRRSVVEHATAAGIDPAWAYGILRQESAFWADARSSAGAVGLMQLLPSTAREVARQLQMKLRSDGDLLEADTNIRLGTAYLRRILDDLGGHPALATAAYNAGPQRARSWAAVDAPVPADLWIESIPFPETHAYVRQVLAYTVIYRERLGLPPLRLTDRLPPVGAAGAESLIDH